MPRPGKRRKIRGKVKLSQNVSLVQKNDKTRVAKPDVANYPRMQAQMPRTVGTVFKVKIRKKQ